MKTKSIIVYILFNIYSYSQNENFTQYVNLFTGTTDEGNLFPGATLPFGMVQLSPDSDVMKPSGYDYKDSMILGFSHTHLSGTGLGDFGDILMMPINTKTANFNNKFPDFKSKFNHKNEKAIPGFYEVILENCKTKVNLTATERCGFQKYIYLQKSNSQGVFIDLNHSIFGTKNTWIPDVIKKCQLNFEDKYTISGYKKSAGWASNQNVYFVIKFNQPILNYFIKDKNKITNNIKTHSDSILQTVVLFKNSNELKIKTGISSTSIENARQNLNLEITDWDFEKYKNQAKEIWNDNLSKIKIDSDENSKALFYTSLYHTLLAPNLLSDANGQYSSSDFKIHTSKQTKHYSTFSLWDTFRAVHPLYSIILPNKNYEFVQSMLKHFENFGRLPIWTLWGNENYCMTGNPAIPVITDAFLKGNITLDTNLVWRALYETSTKLFSKTTFDVQQNYGFIPNYWGEYGSRGDRNRFDLINKYGYIPHDSIRESVTQLLELCYNDWCVAQVALKLNKTKEYNFFNNRCQSYKNIFDKETQYMRPKLANGKWQSPFNPYSVSDWKTSAFVEGNSFQYTFFVPHQIDTLIKLMGGKENFEAKLDSLFLKKLPDSEKNHTGSMGSLGMYAHGNEPSHHITYLYNFINKPEKTAEKTKLIMDTQYTINPSGLSGNDDCGQMSAWYVFSALGLYPVNPADGKYYFGTSKLNSAIINYSEKKALKINYIKSNPNQITVAKIILNDKILTQNYITHSEIINGGILNIYFK
ncbi:MAG: glycoside hydrolase family 92 protein [Bacteroidetes bacterium]|nr:MAG: glycoside hydrolase family 92 protein [Bacteroidota bacterium]